MEAACGVAHWSTTAHGRAWQILPLGRAPGRTRLMLLWGGGGPGGQVPFALAGLSPTPPHPSLPLPQPHPWPWPWLVSQLWSQRPQAREGVIWLPLVSERLILSVDCPFFVILLLFCSVVLCNILLHRLFYSRKLEEYLL